MRGLARRTSRSRAIAMGVAIIGATIFAPAVAPGGELGSERVRAIVDARLGLAKTPFPSSTAPEISGLLTSVLLVGETTLAPALVMRLRLPVVLAGVDQPAGGAHATTAWGNPEAAVFWRLYPAAAPRLRVGLALAVPLPGGKAAGGRRPFDNQALLLASAQRGHHEQELYAPGRAAITPSARADVTRGDVTVSGELKIPFMAAVVRGASEPETNTRPVAISAEGVGGVSLLWWRLMAGVRSCMAVELLPASELRGTSPTRWTLTIDPTLSIRINTHVAAGISATTPVAGALSPTTAMGLALAGGW